MEEKVITSTTNCLRNRESIHRTIIVIQNLLYGAEYVECQNAVVIPKLMSYAYVRNKGKMNSSKQLEKMDNFIL